MRRAQDRARSATFKNSGARSATIEYYGARSALKLASEARNENADFFKVCRSSFLVEMCFYNETY